MQAEWGEITLLSPGRPERAAARNAGRVAKPPYLKERQRSAKPSGDRGGCRERGMLSRLAQAVVSWCSHDWPRRQGQQSGER